jgi:hypothetical protein
VDIPWLDPWVGADEARTIEAADGTLERVATPGRMPRDDGGFDTVVGIPHGGARTHRERRLTRPTG